MKKKNSLPRAQLIVGELELSVDEFVALAIVERLAVIKIQLTACSLLIICQKNKFKMIDQLKLERMTCKKITFLLNVTIRVNGSSAICVVDRLSLNL
jgi:hypothetical protein